MEPKFRFEYEETEQTFTDMYMMYYKSRSGYGYKLTIFFMGLLILFMQVSPDPSVLTPKYIITYALMWALAFLLGYLGNKYVYSRFNVKNAAKSGRQAYEERVKKRGTELQVVINCFEEYFGMVFQDQNAYYTYQEISRLMETERMYGVVVGGIRGQKKMICFPKAALEGDKDEEFRRFMAAKCVNVAGGFKELKD
ncbi:hypothetical protein [uncultured Merdimonas sp.]|uniref:hypothetical protein n=1 Tax=uncultured Merdimonas sp. TaxID=2023269 RepID=UPI00320AF63E